MGGRGDEEGRPRKRPYRAGEGAALGPGPGERRDHRAAPAAAGHARPRRTVSARRPTASRARSSSCTRSRSSRQPATASRAGSSCSTCRSRPTARRCSSAARRVARRGAGCGRDARPLRRPARAAAAAHRRPPLRRRRAADSGGRDHNRGCRRGCNGCTTAARTVKVRLRMEAKFLARRGLLQRRRRDSRPRAPGRSRRGRRPHRFLGRRHRIDRRRRRMRGDVGSAAPDEEAESAAAAHRARRAVDQRGERNTRRRTPTAIATAIELSNHVLMLESDSGVFRPTGFGFTGTPAGRTTVTAIATLLRGIQADRDRRSGGGNRYRAERRGGRRAGDVTGGGWQLLPHPPHAGRHRRQDRSGRTWAVRRQRSR